jgi:hypothetical protein
VIGGQVTVGVQVIMRMLVITVCTVYCSFLGVQVIAGVQVIVECWGAGYYEDAGYYCVYSLL